MFARPASCLPMDLRVQLTQISTVSKRSMRAAHLLKCKTSLEIAKTPQIAQLNAIMELALYLLDLEYANVITKSQLPVFAIQLV